MGMLQSLSHNLRSVNPILTASALITFFFTIACTSPAAFLYFSSFGATKSSISPSPSGAGVLSKSAISILSQDPTNFSLLTDFSLSSHSHRRNNAPLRPAIDDRYGDLQSCNLYDGNWVVDDTKPGYSPASCPFLGDAFNCDQNGRRDSDYKKLRWQPKACNLSKFDGRTMLERLRGKRLVFVGDSLNRNMWESLLCLLSDSRGNRVEKMKKAELRTKGHYAVQISDFNCSIEFVATPFLVQESKTMNSTSGVVTESLQLDAIHKLSSRYKNADIIVFNTGHWWTHEKTSRGKNYYVESGYIYPELNVMEAYKKALETWGRWVDGNIDAHKTLLFFRGYSETHFRRGQWSSGGGCEEETKPITSDDLLPPYPTKMGILESVLGEMRTPVTYLNITKMTAYRKDAHPSSFRPSAVQRRATKIQDCSHWCLPGVPDAWNELLYNELLRSEYQIQLLQPMISYQSDL